MDETIVIVLLVVLVACLILSFLDLPIFDELDDL